MGRRDREREKSLAWTEEMIVYATQRVNQISITPLRIVEIMIIKFICKTSSNSDHEWTLLTGAMECAADLCSRITHTYDTSARKDDNENWVHIIITDKHIYVQSASSTSTRWAFLLAGVFFLFFGYYYKFKQKPKYTHTQTQKHTHRDIHIYIECYLIFGRECVWNLQPFCWCCGQIIQNSVTIQWNV